MNSHPGIMLIGLGAHARRIHYPLLRTYSGEWGVRLACIVDLNSRKADILSYLKAQGDSETPVYCFEPQQAGACLTPYVAKELGRIVSCHEVRGVIISTCPLSHIMYARWALTQGLSVLMEKPISSRENPGTDRDAAQGIWQDYEELVELYSDTKQKYTDVLFSILVQRRYHPMFRKVRELIRDVFLKTNCPVTSVQSFHCDGQWRFPNELVEIDYHPFNRGYGKCSHSGYHFFDLVTWFLKAAESTQKKADRVEVFTNFVRPLDFAAQLTQADYERVFSVCQGQRAFSNLLPKHMLEKCGEIDAFSSFVFKRDGAVQTLASVNLLHNGFSQRGWIDTEGRDLYRGNGRVRQESHIIEQGPFQSLVLHSFRSKDVYLDQEETGRFAVGGDHHCELNVFRNSNLFREWKSHERFAVDDLALSPYGRVMSHQEDAKRLAVMEFARHLGGHEVKPVSDLTTHGASVRLMSCIYQSAVNRQLGLNPLVTAEL